MNIEIWQIGKPKADPFDELAQKYIKRLSNIFKIKFQYFKESNKSNLPPDQIKANESETMIDAFSSRSFIVVLDEKGSCLDSVKFAKKILDVQENPVYDKLIFCIGGAYGFNEHIRAKAQLVLSMSEMTFPHKMVKLFLVEQLYRAHTINHNHKYHKS